MKTLISILITSALVGITALTGFGTETEKEKETKANNVIDLHLATGAYTEIALDTGVKIDAHGSVAGVLRQ